MEKKNQQGGTKDEEKVDFRMNLICFWGGGKTAFLDSNIAAISFYSYKLHVIRLYLNFGLFFKLEQVLNLQHFYFQLGNH